jgi:hypothetical protein
MHSLALVVGVMLRPRQICILLHLSLPRRSRGQRGMRLRGLRAPVDPLRGADPQLSAVPPCDAHRATRAGHRQMFPFRRVAKTAGPSATDVVPHCSVERPRRGEFDQVTNLKSTCEHKKIKQGRRRTMVRGLRMLSCSAVLLGAVVAMPGVAAAANCEALANSEIPDVTSIKAKSFPGGTFQPPDPAGFVPTSTLPHASPPIPNLPAFCEVSIVVAPQINIEIWLPLPGAWTNRFRGVGGGGYAGTISWAALADARAGGSATASTDTGHSAFAANNGLGGSGFALNQPGDTSTRNSSRTLPNARNWSSREKAKRSFGPSMARVHASAIGPDARPEDDRAGSWPSATPRNMTSS